MFDPSMLATLFKSGAGPGGFSTIVKPEGGLKGAFTYGTDGGIAGLNPERMGDALKAAGQGVGQNPFGAFANGYQNTKAKEGPFANIPSPDEIQRQAVMAGNNSAIGPESSPANQEWMSWFTRRGNLRGGA